MKENNESENLEAKYNPERIHGNTWNHFRLIDKNIEYRNLVIRIEIKESNNKCYFIGSTEKKLVDITERECEKKHGFARDRFELSNNRNSLGKVTVLHNWKPIHEPFPTYDEFWNTIKSD